MIESKKVFMIYAIYSGCDFVLSGVRDTKEEAEELLKKHPFMEGTSGAPLYIMEVIEYRNKLKEINNGY